MRCNTIGKCNTAIGTRALCTNTTGNYNTAIGVNSLKSNTTGISNTAIGYQSQNNNTVGTKNTSLGAFSSVNSSGGIQNTSIGWGALYTNTNNCNTAVGTCSLYTNSIGQKNTALGNFTLKANTIGSWNTAIGESALVTNTEGYNNVSIGYGSLRNNTTGYETVAIGNQSLCSNTTGYRNTAIGTESMRLNTIGIHNTAIGYASLKANTTGVNNTAIGFNSLAANTASYNIGLGRDSGDNITSGTGNVIIGSVDATSATGSRQLKIAGYDGTDTTTWITGDSSGKIGIGTSNPQTTLHIAAGIPKIRIEDTDLSGMFFDIRGASSEIVFDLDPNSSQGLPNYSFDIGGSTKMRLRGNGRLGIGTTTPNSTLTVSGDLTVSRAGDTLKADFSNGVNANFRILTSGSVAQIGPSTASDLVFLSSNTERMRMLASGGLTFGGDTAEANALDDYEEGTWTPALDSVGQSNASGQYTKIGNVCTAKFKISSDGSGSNINITGFPFTSQSGCEQQGLSRETQTSGKLFFIRVGASATTGTIIRYDASNSITSNDTFEGQITYITNT